MQTLIALSPVTILMQVINIVLWGGIIYLFVLAAKALKKYIKSDDIRKEKAASAKTIGSTPRICCEASNKNPCPHQKMGA